MTHKVCSKRRVALLAITLLPTAAAAGPIQKFDFMGSGGTIAYTQNIGSPFLAMAGVNTLISLPGGQHFPIGGGVLNIQTGGCDVGSKCFTPNGQDTLVLSFADSGATGISVTGSLNFGPGSPFNLPAGSTLFTGELINTSAVLRGNSAPTPSNCSASQHAAGMCGPDTGGLNGEIAATFINPDLLKGLGFTGNTSNPSQSFEQLDFSILASVIFGPGQTIGGLGNPSDSSITLTDLLITVTPEPTSLVLFGSSVLLAAAALRRKLASVA